MIYGHSGDIETFHFFQPHLANHPLLKDVKRILIAPLAHGNWWLTVGWDYVKRPNWKWGMTVDKTFAQWSCGGCAATHKPVDDLEDRLFTMADKNVTKDGEIACVCMRMGDWDLHAGDSEGRNLGMWIDILKAGVLYRVLSGKTKDR